MRPIAPALTTREHRSGSALPIQAILPMLLLALSAGGCGTLLGIAGYPPEAMRKAQPAGIEARAVAVGDITQPLTLANSDGRAVTFGGPARGDTLLVFYRGHW